MSNKQTQIRLFEDGNRLVIEIVGVDANIKDALIAMFGGLATPISGLDNPPPMQEEPVPSNFAPPGYAEADENSSEEGSIEEPTDETAGEQDAAEPSSQKEPEVQLPFGAYKGQTPSEAIAKDGAKAWLSLADLIPTLEKRKAQWPANIAVLDCVRDVCRSTLSKMKDEPRTPKLLRCISYVMPEESVNKVLQALSCSTLDDVIKNADLTAQALEIFIESAA